MPIDVLNDSSKEFYENNQTKAYAFLAADKLDISANSK
jgi:hypothetical protein